ncbi:MAG TPA: 23S rRNA (adenine(2503)-C(2))-methyltransferase RlmN [Anaerolineae bacterium]|nr:23S rRNA (adenine(2503)-C(2))-methyltransferase RlmN [Anaerolineae bacterium]HIQ06716.1 23S rRNA (adenine(2503)-C(2))-methyltransferase RlmN [Anaerolineae bacterium]
MSDRIQLLDLSKAQLQELLISWGQPRYRADQLWRWLYGELQDDFEVMTNIPRALRARLASEATAQALAPAVETRSQDRLTHKTLFRLADGQTIEAVLMLYKRRRTVCISTQVGCGMGCPFCATGLSDFTRNLTPGEIVAQVLYFARRLADPMSNGSDMVPIERPARVTNVVVMGMGEPLVNYEATWQALRTLMDQEGLNLGARHITVSTVGIVPGIDRFSQEPEQVGLAISLHAADDALRDRLVPINRRYPLRELMAACHRYVRRTRRRISFEYALMRGINDAPEQAQQLANLLNGLLCHVNLIPLNPVDGSPYQPSRAKDVEAFVHTLRDRKIPVTLRLRRGIDIEAGCGQLRQRVASRD